MRQQISKVVSIALLLLPAAVAFCAGEAEAPESAAPAAEDVENIVVTGQRPEALRKLMLDFIVEIGDPASFDRGYARWQDRLCVGVYNLPDAAAAHYIADKVTLVALELGLKTGSPGCTPNLHIVFSPDARALATEMVEDAPHMFCPFGGTGGTTQGVMALEQFKTSDAPVRWWQVTMVVDETGQPAITLPGYVAPTVRAIASRIKSTINDAIWGSLIIVDAGKLDDVKWPQLADYLAMVSLAQINPDRVPSSYDSILNLFSADKPPAGLTDMDRTYLHALYDMDTRMLPHTQRGVFSSRMVRVRRDMEVAEAPR